MAKVSKKLITTAKKELVIKKDDVFIIMPYGGFSDLYYDTIYCKAIEKAQLNPHRLDESNLPIPIVQEMYESTKNAKIVLADLTGNNANVSYELGLSHGLNKPTIIIKDSSEEIPFDVSAFRVIKYDKNLPEWGKELREKLTEALTEVSKNPNNFLPSRLLKTSDISEDEKPHLTGEVQEYLTSSDFRQRMLRELELKRELGLKRELELKNEMIHHSRHLSSTIGHSEAKILLEQYIKNKEKDSFIISKLVRLGAPRSWVIKQLSEKNKRKK